MRPTFLSIVFILSSLPISTQDTPLCDASFLQLESLEIGFTDLIANLRLTPQEEVLAYDLQYDFLEDGEVTTQVFSASEPFFGITIPAKGTHTFTALNRCSDGLTHTGSTFSIAFEIDTTDIFCPIPTNLVIEMFDPTFVLFTWDAADSVDFWQVSYQPEGLATQDFSVDIPLVEQVLEPTVRHTFSLYAVCDDEMFGPPLTQTQSPTVTFSLVIVEDVKLLPISCDSLTQITWSAFQMECTEHGDFGPNKEEYVYTHGCEDCTTTTSNQEEEESLCWKVYPNPNAGQLQIEYCLEQSTWVHFELYELSGRQLWRSPSELAPAGTNQYFPHRLDMLPTGTYWLIAHLGERRHLEKVMVQ